MIHPYEVSKLYRLADLFASASTSETLGLTYLEALASGFPTLRRKDECIENVIINGKTGYQYTNFKEFETYLYTLIKDRKTHQKMAKYTTEFTVAHYSSTSFGQRVNTIYERALESYPEQQLLQI